MKQIPLSQGKFALVDDEDYEWLIQWNWYLKPNGYAIRKSSLKVSKNRKRILMHRQIMNPPDGMVIDHINGDKLDNRRQNLRICTSADNAKNQKVQENKIGKTSRYKGVYWHKRANKWMARIGGMYLGIYHSEIDAALVYNEASKKYHGEFGRINEI